MKFRATFKSPDAVFDAIKLEFDGMDENENEETVEDIEAKCRKWLRWGEYLTVEIDTDAMTCKVLEAKQ